jgi:hypothetical protein
MTGPATDAGRDPAELAGEVARLEQALDDARLEADRLRTALRCCRAYQRQPGHIHNIVRRALGE